MREVEVSNAERKWVRHTIYTLIRCPVGGVWGLRSLDSCHASRLKGDETRFEVSGMSVMLMQLNCRQQQLCDACLATPWWARLFVCLPQLINNYSRCQVASAKCRIVDIFMCIFINIALVRPFAICPGTPLPPPSIVIGTRVWQQ